MLYAEGLCNREGGAVHGGETFEECSILFKSKEDEDFNHPVRSLRPTGQARIQ